MKHYESDLPGYETLTTALGYMTHMAHHINEMKRRHEHAVRVQEVQSQLEDYADGPDLSTLGELVLEVNPMHVFCFNHLIQGQQINGRK